MNVFAQTADDINLLSCFLGNSITNLGWVNLENNIFSLRIYRYCWEKNIIKSYNKKVLCDFKVSNVQNIFHSNISKPQDFFCFLDISKHENIIQLAFNDDKYLILKTEKDPVVFIEDSDKFWYSDI
jgi:hypothetical protein